MFKVRLKWINFLISGLILHLSVIYFCGWIILPFTMKSLLTSIVLFIIWSIISAFLVNIGESYNIIWSPFTLFKKRKFIYHNKLGYFLIFISSEKIDVFEVKWFKVKEKVTIKNTGNLKEVVKQMKESLDEVFKSQLAHLKSLELQKENIKIIKEWDGLLIDIDERRDNKIDNILKK